MTRHKILLTALLLVGFDLVSAQGLDGLFLQMTFAFGNFQENHYFFLPDGRYLNGVPAGGLTAADVDRACAARGSICGKYKVSGSEITLVPLKGRAETLSLERSADGNLKLGGLFAKHVDKFPASAKLEGKFSRVGNAGPVSSAKSYTFRPDGTFSSSSLGAVTTEGGVGKSSSSASGTYRLSGNVLELTGDGATKRLVAYPYDVGKGDIRLNLDGEFYRKQ